MAWQDGLSGTGRKGRKGMAPPAQARGPSLWNRITDAVAGAPTCPPSTFLRRRPDGSWTCVQPPPRPMGPPPGAMPAGPARPRPSGFDADVELPGPGGDFGSEQGQGISPVDEGATGREDDPGIYERVGSQAAGSTQQAMQQAQGAPGPSDFDLDEMNIEGPGGGAGMSGWLPAGTPAWVPWAAAGTLGYLAWRWWRKSR